MSTVVQKIVDQLGRLDEQERRIKAKKDALKEQLENFIDPKKRTIQLTGESYQLYRTVYHSVTINYAKILADLNVSRQRLVANSREVPKVRWTLKRI